MRYVANPIMWPGVIDMPEKSVFSQPASQHKTGSKDGVHL
jgi:hypothetical protein